jgi:hypothetical protein
MYVCAYVCAYVWDHEHISMSLQCFEHVCGVCVCVHAFVTCFTKKKDACVRMWGPTTLMDIHEAMSMYCIYVCVHESATSGLSMRCRVSRSPHTENDVTTWSRYWNHWSGCSNDITSSYFSWNDGYTSFRVTYQDVLLLLRALSTQVCKIHVRMCEVCTFIHTRTHVTCICICGKRTCFVCVHIFWRKLDVMYASM